MDLPAEVYGQLSFLICTLMIQLRFLQPVNCSITCQEKINYLRKNKLFKDCKDLPECYYGLLVNFPDLICLRLKKYDINQKNLRLAKSVIMNK